MTFTSLLFALFVGITLVVYYVLPAKKYQWAVLLAAGYFFYLYNSYRYAAFILATTITIYAAGRAISKVKTETSQKIKEMKGEWTRDEKKAFKQQAEKKKKAILTITLLFNFGILFILKYLNFMAGGLMHLLGGGSGDAQIISILLPLGASYSLL